MQNPHIVEIYDWGSLPDNSRFFVMEYLEGRSLGDLLARMPKAPGSDRRQPLPEDFALNISMQIAEGLKAAHDIGIVHRDIKPDNFHIVRRPEEPYFVKILDFGIAKVQNSKAARTRTGSVFGTPHYMSPEQASGDKNIDATTDIYGLGVLMYEMVVGKIPFDADNLMGILTAHLYHTPAPPSIYPECEKLSKSFEAVVLKCLAKDREARYQSMGELYEDLARCSRGDALLASCHQEVMTMRFWRADFLADAATVIRQLPTELLQPASPEELNAALGLHGASQPSPAPTSGAPSHVSGAHAMPMAAQAAPPAHSMSLPAPQPASMGARAASPFEGVGKIQFADPHAHDPANASLPPGTEVARPRAKTGLIVGAIVGVGALIAVGIVALASSLNPAGTATPAGPDTTATTQSQLQPGRVEPSAPPPDAAPAVQAPVAQTPTAHTVPAAQAEPVVIQSNVAGARVYRGGQQIGVTPHAVARPAVGEESYTVSAEGFADQSVVITPTTATPLVVSLSAAAVVTDPPRAPRTDHRDRPPRPRRDRPAPQGTTPANPHGLQDPWS